MYTTPLGVHCFATHTLKVSSNAVHFSLHCISLEKKPATSIGKCDKIVSHFMILKCLIITAIDVTAFTRLKVFKHTTKWWIEARRVVVKRKMHSNWIPKLQSAFLLPGMADASKQGISIPSRIQSNSNQHEIFTAVEKRQKDQRQRTWKKFSIRKESLENVFCILKRIRFINFGISQHRRKVMYGHLRTSCWNQSRYV